MRGKQDGLASGRCLLCHRLRYRVHQALRRTNSTQEWGDVSGDRKAAFCVAAANLFGDKLQKLVTSTLLEARIQKTVTEFSSRGALRPNPLWIFHVKQPQVSSTISSANATRHSRKLRRLPQVSPTWLRKPQHTKTTPIELVLFLTWVEVFPIRSPP